VRQSRPPCSLRLGHGATAAAAALPRRGHALPRLTRTRPGQAGHPVSRPPWVLTMSALQLATTGAVARNRSESSTRIDARRSRPVGPPEPLLGWLPTDQWAICEQQVKVYPTCYLGMQTTLILIQLNSEVSFKFKFNSNI
jgi:hypothetical protein